MFSRFDTIPACDRLTDGRTSTSCPNALRIWSNAPYSTTTAYHRDTLRIFTSTLYGKTKTNTNPNPDPNRYRRRCPDHNAMIQKKELQIKTEEDGNFKAEKYKIEIEVNILNTLAL